MNESDFEREGQLCNRSDVTLFFDEDENADSVIVVPSTMTTSHSSTEATNGDCSFVSAVETNRHEEVEMCAGHSDSSSDADEPMSTVELLEGEEDAADTLSNKALAAVACDGLLAESLNEEQLSSARKSNSDSSGMSSPDDLEELDEVGAGSASVDATLDFLDMDIDPRDLSASSSPVPPSNLREVTNPVLNAAKRNCSESAVQQQAMGGGMQPTDEGFEQEEPGSTVELIDDDDDDNLPCTSSLMVQSVFQKTPLTCVVGCAACSGDTSLVLSTRCGRRNYERGVDRLLVGGSTGRDILHQLLSGAVSPARKELSFNATCALKTVSDVFSENLEIPQSGCGLVAVLNVLCGLEEMVKPTRFSVKAISDLISVQVRALQAPLDRYLLSRSVAGTTHVDLIRAIESFTGGEIRGRFFPTANVRDDVCLVDVIAHWIRSKAAPVLTLNLQRELSENSIWRVEDAWHHQLAFAVGSDQKTLLLDYPREIVNERRLRRVLTGPSTLLVRSTDVLAAWDRGSTFSQLIAHATADQRWTELNVIANRLFAGQVMSVVRQASAPWSGLDSYSRTSHISIPAAYTPGISVFARSSSDQWREIENAPCLE